MPIIIAQHNKRPAINQILQLAQRWIFVNCSPDSRMAINAHVDWMLNHQDDLMVACRFETSADRRTTTIIFETSFVQQQPSIKTGN